MFFCMAPLLNPAIQVQVLVGPPFLTPILVFPDRTPFNNAHVNLVFPCQTCLAAANFLRMRCLFPILTLTGRMPHIRDMNDHCAGRMPRLCDAHGHSAWTYATPALHAKQLAL